MENFLDALRTQRWDDHRYYHHSRINQSLHFVSALSFLFSYVMIFRDPAISALAGWLVAMTTRQTGHFFFEPKDYDAVNAASHEYKEEIKVGYNLRRKVVLLTIWALSPLVLFVSPRFFGLFTPATDKTEFVRQVAIIWLGLGVGGVLFRTIQLFVIKDVQTGLVWATKISDRSVSRHQNLSQGSACAVARRTDRSRDRPASLGRGRSRRAAADQLIAGHGCAGRLEHDDFGPTHRYRHCEERSDEAIQAASPPGLLRFARNDEFVA